MELTVVGCGYVGLVTAACFADLGNRVIGVDVDAVRVQALKKGRIPIYEPGLEEIVRRNIKDGRLTFQTSLADAVRASRIIFIAVGTPPAADGDVDLTAVRMVAAEIGKSLNGDKIIVNKSTVPVGMADAVGDMAQKSARGKKHKVRVVSNPEFLREGTAVTDFMHPDRVVVGSSDKRAAEAVADLYRPLDAHVIVTDVRSAEMIKYASNAFLATKISFINEIASLCEKLGADVAAVANGMGKDKRIGREFLYAGVGFGGSCLPKDVAALRRAVEKAGLTPRLLAAVLEVNESQRRSVVEKLSDGLGKLAGKTVAVLGLAFKPSTDDLREAVSQTVLPQLIRAGAKVRAYDPAANEGSKRNHPQAVYCKSALDAAKGAHAAVVLTEWNEFVELDLVKLRGVMAGQKPVLVDGRNVYDPDKAKAAGFTYRGVGRG